MANEGGKSGDFDERADRRRVEHVVLQRAEVLANAATGVWVTQPLVVILVFILSFAQYRLYFAFNEFNMICVYTSRIGRNVQKTLSLIGILTKLLS